MSFIGYYQLGDILPVTAWCRDSNKTPAEPDDVPTVHVYDSTGNAVVARTIPILDREKITGFFHYRVNLDSNFSAGYHTIMFNYEISSTSYAEMKQFEILPGGNGQGNGIAMHFFKQPAADYVLMQTDTGSLKRLRNPSVRGA